MVDAGVGGALLGMCLGRPRRPQRPHTAEQTIAYFLRAETSAKTEYERWRLARAVELLTSPDEGEIGSFGETLSPSSRIDRARSTGDD